jgi:hypothetical protein
VTARTQHIASVPAARPVVALAGTPLAARHDFRFVPKEHFDRARKTDESIVITIEQTRPGIIRLEAVLSGDTAVNQLVDQTDVERLAASIAQHLAGMAALEPTAFPQMCANIDATVHATVHAAVREADEASAQIDAVLPGTMQLVGEAAESIRANRAQGYDEWPASGANHHTDQNLDAPVDAPVDALAYHQLPKSRGGN